MSLFLNRKRQATPCMCPCHICALQLKKKGLEQSALEETHVVKRERAEYGPEHLTDTG